MIYFLIAFPENSVCK